jgi:hypothetical protein
MSDADAAKWGEPEETFISFPYLSSWPDLSLLGILFVVVSRYQNPRSTMAKNVSNTLRVGTQTPGGQAPLAYHILMRRQVQVLFLQNTLVRTLYQENTSGLIFV